MLCIDGPRELVEKVNYETHHEPGQVKRLRNFKVDQGPGNPYSVSHRLRPGASDQESRKNDFAQGPADSITWSGPSQVYESLRK